MKRILFIPVCTLLLFSCDSHTYEDLQADLPIVEGAVTYNAHVKSIVDANCVSCHSGGGVASFRPLTTYAQVKDAVLNTNLLDRIQRQNGQEGQMPQTGRMSPADIQMILQWDADGLPEN